MKITTPGATGAPSFAGVAAAPSARLVRVLIRKHLDQMLELLESIDPVAVDVAVDPDQPLEETNASRAFRIDVRVSRLTTPRSLQLSTVEKTTPQRHSATRGVDTCRAGAPRLKRAHRQILLKASLTEPQPAKRLIKDAGYTDNSYGWSLITELARWRWILRTPDGYLLTPEGEAQVRPRAS